MCPCSKIFSMCSSHPTYSGCVQDAAHSLFCILCRVFGAEDVFLSLVYGIHHPEKPFAWCEFWSVCHNTSERDSLCRINLEHFSLMFPSHCPHSRVSCFSRGHSYIFISVNNTVFQSLEIPYMKYLVLRIDTWVISQIWKCSGT